jgi:hypothetical protein
MKFTHPNYPSLLKEIRLQLALSQEDPAFIFAAGVTYPSRNRQITCKTLRLYRINYDIKYRMVRDACDEQRSLAE